MNTNTRLHLLVSAHDRRRLSVESKRSLEAVNNAIDGCSKPVVALSVKQAATTLGIELPSPTLAPTGT